MIKLYENIKELRKLNHWTQEELAQKMGYTDRSMIAKIEAGKVDLARSKIIEFAKVFNVPPGDLMDEEGWQDYTPPEGTPTFTVSRENLKGMILSDEERDLIILLRNTTEEKRRLLMQLLEFLLSIKEE
jgi:transcriptional regulator with XRE-family HTH domain